MSAASLIAADVQLRLTTADMPNETFAPTEAIGEYTAERLFKFRRQEYDLVVRMIGEDMSNISIARIMQMAEKTVAAVRQREADLLPGGAVRQLSARKWRNITGLYQDILIDRASDPTERKKMKTQEVAIVASIATDKWQLQEGEPTQRVEYVERDSGHNDFNAFLESMGSAAGALPGTVTPALPEPDNSATESTPIPTTEPAALTQDI